MIVITKFYTCQNHLAFKEVFMQESNKDLLVQLLEKILKVKIKEVKIADFEHSFCLLESREDNFHLLLTTDAGIMKVAICFIEKSSDTLKNMAYICDVYHGHTTNDNTYNEDVMIVQINFNYYSESKKGITIYSLQDDTEKEYVHNLKIYEINMSRYMDIWKAKDLDKIEENKEIIMLNLGLDDLAILSRNDAMVEKYMHELQKVNENYFC